MNKEHLDEVWFKARQALKDTKLMNKLKNFDIRMINGKQIELVRNLFANDPWMTYNWIRRESQFASNIFLWVNEIITYVEVANKLKSLGMKKIEEKSDEALNLKNLYSKLGQEKRLFVRINMIKT